MASAISFTVESACINWSRDQHLYRIRVPSAQANPTMDPVTIKYLVGPCSRDPARAIPDHRGQLLTFNTLPAGDWNLGHLTHNAQSQYLLTSTSTTDLASTLGLRSAGPTWHATTFDLTTLLDAFYARRALQPPNPDPAADYDPPTDIQCTGYLSAALLPDPTRPNNHSAVAVGIWAWEPGLEYGIAAESHIYSLLQSDSSSNDTPLVAPRFLGHLTDNNSRVVGFLLERVPAGTRMAGPGDVEACRAALGRLHARGVAYGAPLRRHSFLVCPDGDGRVLMQGFGGAFETGEEGVFMGEMEGLEGVLLGQEEVVGVIGRRRLVKAKV